MLWCDHREDERRMANYERLLLLREDGEVEHVDQHRLTPNRKGTSMQISFELPHVKTGGCSTR